MLLFKTKCFTYVECFLSKFLTTTINSNLHDLYPIRDRFYYDRLNYAICTKTDAKHEKQTVTSNVFLEVVQPQHNTRNAFKSAQADAGIVMDLYPCTFCRNTLP